MTWDRPIYGISAGSQLAAEISLGLFTLVALGYCVWLARRDRKVWPLMVWAGGAPMALWEPMQNIVTHVVYPEIDQHTAFEIYDRPMPIYLVLVYMCYFGIWVPLLMKKFEDYVSVRQVMRYYFITVAFAAAFEPVPVSGFKWWQYYGSSQPLKFFGIPIWWFFVNAMVIVGVAVIFTVLRRRVLTADWQSVVFIPGGLFVCGGLHLSAGIPVYAAIGSGLSSATTIPLSLVSCGLAIVWVYLLARLATTPTPARDLTGTFDSAVRAERVAPA
ncbi:conserved membrane hypothetical protein [Frankia sp. Hr75.2]|nr:conserved membrane hypothetical protein [Frankia sp. Hr75.2]